MLYDIFGIKNVEYKFEIGNVKKVVGCLFLLIVATIGISGCISISHQLGRFTERTVDITLIRWYPGHERLSMVDKIKVVDDQTKAGLLGLDLTGVLVVEGRDRKGFGPTSKIILIMSKPISEPVQFSIPSDKPIILIQREDNWQVIPPDAPALQRAIRFEPDFLADGTPVTSYWIELATGGLQGADAFLWDKVPPQ